MKKIAIDCVIESKKGIACVFLQSAFRGAVSAKMQKNHKIHKKTR